MKRLSWRAALSLTLTMPLAACSGGDFGDPFSVVSPSIRDLNLGGEAKTLDSIDCLNIANARVCALATAAELSKKLSYVSKVDRFGEVLLFALGAATGFSIAKDFGKDVLEDLGLAIGGLTGFNSLLATDEQAKLYDKALTATLCMVRAYDGLAVVSSARFENDGSLNKDNFNTALDTEVTRTALAAKAVQSAAQYAVSELTSDNIVGVGPEMLALNAAQSLHDAALALMAAAQNRDAHLSAAIIYLRMELSRQLQKIGDSAALWQTQTDQMTNSIKDVVSKRKAFDQAMAALRSAGGRQNAQAKALLDTAELGVFDSAAVSAIIEYDSTFNATKAPDAVNTFLSTTGAVDSVLKECISAADYSTVFE